MKRKERTEGREDETRGEIRRNEREGRKREKVTLTLFMFQMLPFYSKNKGDEMKGKGEREKGERGRR
jgi:hypothetical protein